MESETLDSGNLRVDGGAVTGSINFTDNIKITIAAEVATLNGNDVDFIDQDRVPTVVELYSRSELTLLCADTVPF